jgi:hypothetical protein
MMHLVVDSNFSRLTKVSSSCSLVDRQRVLIGSVVGDVPESVEFTIHSAAERLRNVSKPAYMLFLFHAGSLGRPFFFFSK